MNFGDVPAIQNVNILGTSEEVMKMQTLELIHGSCANQKADVIVNAANCDLLYGGGICKVIFDKAGVAELTAECQKYNTPLKDGEAVITPSLGLKNAKAIVHAVGPDFRKTPRAFKELFEAYFNSLIVTKDNGYHSISFPLISSSIFAGKLANPVEESTKQCCRAYDKFIRDFPDYDMAVYLCAYTDNEYTEAKKHPYFQDGPGGYDRWDSGLGVVSIEEMERRKNSGN